jgi:hypothetical protein
VDKSKLEELEANAKAEERMRKKKARKEHVLLQASSEGISKGDTADEIGLVERKSMDMTFLDVSVIRVHCRQTSC